MLFENGALDEMIVGREEPVESAGASTVTVPVTIEQKLDAAASPPAAAVVWAVWDSVTMALSPPAAALVATEATDVGAMVSVAMTLPGTVAVAVIGTKESYGQSCTNSDKVNMLTRDAGRQCSGSCCSSTLSRCHRGTFIFLTSTLFD